MQFNYAIDPRIGQWLNLVAFVLAALAMASWWQDFFSAKEVACAVGVMNLSVSAINYVLHGMPPLPAAVTNAAKAVIVFAIVLLALLVGRPAHAQMALKAPAGPTTAATVCSLVNCTSLYAGGNLVNSGGDFDVIGSGLSGLAANGVMFGGQFGAEFWNGSLFAAVEADVEYDITTNGQIGTGTSGQYAIGGQVKLGYALASLFGAATTGAATPALPAVLSNALISPYIAVGAWKRPWGTGLLTGAGVEALIANNWTLDPEYFHVVYNNAAVNANTNQQSENDFMLGLNYHFQP